MASQVTNVPRISCMVRSKLSGFCLNKLKNARRLATRYDKTADSYLGFIHIVSIRLWMLQFVNRS